MKINKPVRFTGTLLYGPDLRFTPWGQCVTTIIFEDNIMAQAWDLLAERIADDENLVQGAVMKITGTRSVREWKTAAGVLHSQAVITIMEYSVEVQA